MEVAAQKRYARLALLVFAVLGGSWLLQLDYAAKISTNIVDLIPGEERSPEVSLVRSLVGQRQARVMLFALQQQGAPVKEEAVERFSQALQGSGHFPDVVVLGGATVREAIGKFIFDQRLQLLLPDWLERQHKAFLATGQPASEFSPWLAGRAASALDAFLSQPESIAFQELIPSDPLLLVPTLTERAEGLGFAHESRQASLVWCILGPSPFDEDGQAPVFETIGRAEAAARAIEPQLELRWTGINRFAAESRQRIQAEMSFLNLISIGAVLAVACLFVRHLWKALHLLPVVLLSIMGAWVMTTLCFERVHILVFVIGSLLTGVAIDYGFYLYMQPALRAGETYGEKLRRLIKPLLTSCLTTVIGFSFLLWSELPLIQQLGVFVSAGLVSALTAAILYFAQLDHAYLQTRELPRPDTRRARVWLRAGGVVLVAASIFGITRLTWRDDVRELEVPSPGLRANDLHVRQLFGDAADRGIYITRGANVAEARSQVDRFLAWNESRHPGATPGTLAWLIPSPSAWTNTPRLLGQLGSFDSDLMATLETGGYTPESFEPFREAWRRLQESLSGARDYDQMVGDVARNLVGPLGLLMHAGEDGAWFMTITEEAQMDALPAELTTVSLSQLESLNSLFSRYRQSALRLSAAGLSLVGASVFVLYGFRRGIRIFAIPAGSCLFAFGVLGLMGHPLNLFHLLGAFLGVCLSHNYAIFSAENAGRHEAPPPSIRLSALTTAASFGVLAFSQIPVVSALGTIVTLVVLCALLVVELEPHATAL